MWCDDLIGWLDWPDHIWCDVWEHWDEEFLRKKLLMSPKQDPDKIAVKELRVRLK